MGLFQSGALLDDLAEMVYSTGGSVVLVASVAILSAALNA
jgi:hypothetical protein